MSYNHVKIYYGPCESFFTVAHKPQKLRGLRDRLRKLGFRVDLAPVEFVNYCVLEMCDHEVFRCNIQNLKFNTSYRLDPVCQRAVNAVKDSSEKFKRARRYLWFWHIIEGQLLARNKHGPRDWWPSQIDLPEYTKCLECVKCCGLNVHPINQQPTSDKEISECTKSSESLYINFG